jgi:predicted dehydrogenase
MTESTPLRWGILSAARIAHKFCEGVKSLPDARLAAVAARDRDRAQEFAHRWGIPRAYGSYDELVNDPEVDAVYVSATHDFHRDHTLLALNAGKPVLCEKPFAINARQAEDMVRTARKRRLFLMEAMWTRFFPIMARLRELIKEGAIGEPRLVQADFGFRTDFDPTSRLFDPARGGGALLDVGIYVVSFASMILGEPNRVEGLATQAPNGVDEQAVISLGYPNGALASLTTAVRTNTNHEASVQGTEGRIRIQREFWKPQSMTLDRSGRDPEVIQLPYESTGFQFEAAEAARCIQAGKLESDVMPLDETLSIMRTLDTLRAKWGIRYPMES